MVNIYFPNGNPVGTRKIRLQAGVDGPFDKAMSGWREKGLPVLVGGDFNVIPEDIDCHKPASWIHDALFQPEPRARYRALLSWVYRRLPIAASWRGRPVHLLGLLSAGVRT